MLASAFSTMLTAPWAGLSVGALFSERSSGKHLVERQVLTVDLYKMYQPEVPSVPPERCLRSALGVGSGSTLLAVIGAEP